MKLSYDTTHSSAQTVLCKLTLNITLMMLVSLLTHCRPHTHINVLIISSSHISRSWSISRLYSSSIHRNDQDDVDERKVGNFTNKTSTIRPYIYRAIDSMLLMDRISVDAWLSASTLCIHDSQCMCYRSL